MPHLKVLLARLILALPLGLVLLELIEFVDLPIVDR